VPVIFRDSGMRFIIYVDDHSPAHVHVEGKGGSAKIGLMDVNLAWSRALSRRDVIRALNVVRDNRFDFLMAWQKIHG
jgi:hypothetical protein